MDGYTIAEAVHEEVLNLIKGRDEIELKVTSRCAVHLCILIILTVIVSECDILIFLDIMKDNLNKKRIKLKKKNLFIYDAHFFVHVIEKKYVNFLHVCFVRDKGIVLLIVLFSIFLDIGMLPIKE